MERIEDNHLKNMVPFFGIVEDNNDPMAIGRARVRCYHFHPEDKNKVPTEDLPWATVLHPTTSSSISGIGSFIPLEMGTMVYGFFADGNNCQLPIVTHTVPGQHRPNNDQEVGGDGACYGSNRPYAQEFSDGRDFSDSPSMSTQPNSGNQGSGALIAQGDIDVKLTNKDKGRFKQLGLTIYSGEKAPDGFACKDTNGSLAFHYGTALAFEKLTKEYGRGKLFITSAYRTPAYNSRLKGAAKNSMHTQGRALDIPFSAIGSSRSDIIRFAKLAVKNGFVGFGVYSSFIHIDTGNGRVWKGASANWFVQGIKEAGWYPGKKGLSGVEVKKGATSDTGEDTAEETPADESAPTTSTKTVDPTKLKTREDRKNYIQNYLKAKGDNDAQIAGALAHFDRESGLNPGSLNPNDKGKPSVGLAQWRGDRQQALYNYTGTKNPNIKQQLDFYVHERENSLGSAWAGNKKAYNAFKNAQTPEAAARALSYYERHENYSSANAFESRKRVGSAVEYYNGNYEKMAVDTTKGFGDPTGSLPTAEYAGSSPFNEASRGFNRCSSQTRIQKRDAGRATGFPAAGDVGTFGEPELKAGPQYPFNKVISSQGHLFEMDDTPGVERLNIEHKSGSGVEIFANGDVSKRSKGNDYNMNEGDSFTGVQGKYFLTSVNDMHMRSTSDMTMQSDGTTNIIVGNDGSLFISGDYVLSVGEDMQLKTGGRFTIQGKKIDILSDSDLNIEAKGTVGIKGGEGVNIQSGAKVSIKGTEVLLDDVVKMANGDAVDVEGADTADVGTPAPRSTVKKDNLKGSTNSGKGIITTEDVMDVYANQVEV